MQYYTLYNNNIRIKIKILITIVILHEKENNS